MRNTFRLGSTTVLAALIALTAAGCSPIDESGTKVRAQRLHASTGESKPAKAAKPRKAAEIVEPKRIAAGETARQFCASRHIEFQAGRLTEAPDVMAKNNELCRQMYETSTGSIPAPQPAEPPKEPR